MELQNKLNKNISMALDQIDATAEEKELLATILYKEHIHRGQFWDDNSVTKEYSDIINPQSAGGQQ